MRGRAAVAFGGGLDAVLTRWLALRVAQLDVDLMCFCLPGMRASAGLLFRFGRL